MHQVDEVDRSLEISGEDIQAEISFGRHLAASILGQYPLLKDKSLNHYVNLVGHSLLKASWRPELIYYFAVLDSEEVNAFAAPGGYIFITKGALRLMRSEAELAAVLAHEIVHVMQRHIVNELGISSQDDLFVGDIFRWIGGSSDSARVAIDQVVNKANDLLFVSGLKQQDEFEADRLSLFLQTQSGYRNNALGLYLKRVANHKGDTVSTLRSTHPSFKDRLHKIREGLFRDKLTPEKGINDAERFATYQKNIK